MLLLISRALRLNRVHQRPNVTSFTRILINANPLPLCAPRASPVIRERALLMNHDTAGVSNGVIKARAQSNDDGTVLLTRQKTLGRS